MHPVNILMEEIYRDYWGIPDTRKNRVRRPSAVSLFERARKARFPSNRG